MWGSSVEQPSVSSYFSGKFTSSYDYEAESTTFLDMEVRIVNGRIETDLYRKETDKIRYLLPSSYHPTHIFDNILYSLANIT